MSEKGSELRDETAKIAAAVLYEGYVLWPYRRSNIKNQQRWTFGGVYPRAFSEHLAGSDPWWEQTECLVLGDAPELEVTVRFLHLVKRQVARQTGQGTLAPVDELRIGGERYLTWEETTEHEVTIPGLKLTEQGIETSHALRFAAGKAEEPLTAPDGAVAGALIRSWRALEGSVEIAARPLGGGLHRVTVRIRNTTDWHGQEREGALWQTLLSAHAVLRVAGGKFVSLMDPPPELLVEAEACQNIKLWPVLVGEESERQTMLAAPIILYDYPRVAPESPGDTFDGTEIDQLLILNVLTLTDEEKAEMRATDPHAREILERSEALTTNDFLRLHGTIREFQVLRPETPELPTFAGLAVPTFGELEATGPCSVQVHGTELRSGSRVILRPKPGGDIFDLALAGRVAYVEAIEQDYEGTIHVAVTLEDDPGRDLGQERQIGHRFFFAPEEVEPLEGEDPGGT